MIKSFKYRLYPSREQTAKLNDTLTTCRTLYNAALEQRKVAYFHCHKSVYAYDQMKELPGLKELPGVRAVYGQVLQNVLWRVNKSFQNFFRRAESKGGKVGYPRFQSRNRYDSFTYPQRGFSIKDGKLHLSKIGNIRIKLHRPIEGLVKTCTIKRDVNEWYAVFSCEFTNAIAIESKTEIGIDVGIESFLTDSNGEQIANPRFLYHSLNKLRRLHRSLARKKRGSNHREKTRVLVAKQYRKIRRERLDFHHKTALSLVRRFDTIVIEDLRVSNMIQNHSLAIHISDVAWAQFAAILTCKAEWAGKSVVRVNPRNTSQACSGCGCIVKKELSERWHLCPECGLSIHRDVNAARNILKLGQGHCLQAVT